MAEQQEAPFGAAPWAEIEGQLKETFPDLPTDVMREQYERVYKLQQNRQEQAGAGMSRTGYFLMNMVPGVSQGLRMGTDVKYGHALNRLLEGTPKDDDYDTVAAYERLKQIEHERTGPQSSWGSYLAHTAARLPAMGIELASGALGAKAVAGIGARALTGGAAAGGAAAAAAAPQAVGYATRAGLTGAGLAATAGLTAMTPSLYAERAVQANLEQGRDPLSVKGLPGAYALGVAQLATLRAAGAVLGNAAPYSGAAQAGIRTAGAAATGPVAMQVADVATSGTEDLAKALFNQSLGLDTGYGTIGTLLKPKEKGGGLNEAMKHAAGAMLTFAVLHAAGEVTGPQRPEAPRSPLSLRDRATGYTYTEGAEPRRPASARSYREYPPQGPQPGYESAEAASTSPVVETVLEATQQMAKRGDSAVRAWSLVDEVFADLKGEVQAGRVSQKDIPAWIREQLSARRRLKLTQPSGEDVRPVEPPAGAWQGKGEFVGWKFHLATDRPEEVSRVLSDLGYKHKVGRSGGQEGKDLTVYVGSRATAEEAARRIHQGAGGLLKEPFGETLKDDMLFAPGVMGRFDTGRAEKDFHQYGSRGVPYLAADMDPFNPPPPGALGRAHTALQKRFGEFYAPPEPPTAPPGRPGAETPPAPAEPPPAPPGAAAPAQVPLAGRSLDEVKGLAKKLGFNVSGGKDAVVGRLRQALGDKYLAQLDVEWDRPAAPQVRQPEPPPGAARRAPPLLGEEGPRPPQAEPAPIEKPAFRDPLAEAPAPRGPQEPETGPPESGMKFGRPRPGGWDPWRDLPPSPGYGQLGQPALAPGLAAQYMRRGGQPPPGWERPPEPSGPPPPEPLGQVGKATFPVNEAVAGSGVPGYGLKEVPVPKAPPSPEQQQRVTQWIEATDALATAEQTVKALREEVRAGGKGQQQYKEATEERNRLKKEVKRLTKQLGLEEEKRGENILADFEEKVNAAPISQVQRDSLKQYLEGMSYQQIADASESSQSPVKKSGAHARVREAIRRMQENDPEVFQGVDTSGDIFAQIKALKESFASKQGPISAEIALEKELPSQQAEAQAKELEAIDERINSEIDATTAEQTMTDLARAIKEEADATRAHREAARQRGHSATSTERDIDAALQGSRTSGEAADAPQAAADQGEGRGVLAPGAGAPAAGGGLSDPVAQGLRFTNLWKTATPQEREFLRKEVKDLVKGGNAESEADAIDWLREDNGHRTVAGYLREFGDAEQGLSEQQLSAVARAWSDTERPIPAEKLAEVAGTLPGGEGLTAEQARAAMEALRREGMQIPGEWEEVAEVHANAREAGYSPEKTESLIGEIKAEVAEARRAQRPDDTGQRGPAPAPGEPAQPGAAAERPVRLGEPPAAGAELEPGTGKGGAVAPPAPPRVDPVEKFAKEVVRAHAESFINPEGQAAGGPRNAAIEAKANELLTGLGEKAKSLGLSLRELAGEQFPRTTDVDREVGEALVRAASARTYAAVAGPDYIDRVMGPGTSERHQSVYGTAFQEYRHRFAVQRQLQDARENSAAAGAARQRAADAKANAAREKAAGNAGNAGAWRQEARRALAEADAHAEKATESMAGARGATSFVGKKGSPLATEAQYQAVLRSEGFRQALERYRDEFVPVVNDLTRRARGMEPDEPIGSLTQIPELPMHAKRHRAGDPDAKNVVYTGVPAGGGNLKNLRVKPDPFARRATLSGDYDTNMGSIIRHTLETQVEVAAKAEAVRTMMDKGLASAGKRGQQVEFNGVRAVEFPDTFPARGSKASQPGETSLYVDPRIARDWRRAIAVDPGFQSEVVKAMSMASTWVALASTAEATSHTKNLLKGLFAPGVIREVPRAVYDTIMGDPKSRAELTELARIGATKPAGFESGNFQSNYNPLKWTSHALDFIDRSMRVAMGRAFDRLTEPSFGFPEGRFENTETEKRNFLSSLGNYNKRTQNSWVRWLRDTGLGPFATAGSNFEAQGIKALIFAPGAKSTGWRADLALRGEVMAKMIGVAGLSMLANYLLWGRVDGDERTPLGAIKVAERGGKTDLVDLTGFTGFTRGARHVGLLALAEGLRRGDSGDEISGKAVSDLAHGTMHPAVGPLPGAVYTAVTGKNTLGTKVAAKPAKGDWQVTENLKAAAANLNPLYATATGAGERKSGPSEHWWRLGGEPKEQQEIQEILWKLLGPFGVKTRGDRQRKGHR